MEIQTSEEYLDYIKEVFLQRNAFVLEDADENSEFQQKLKYRMKEDLGKEFQKDKYDKVLTSTYEDILNGYIAKYFMSLPYELSSLFNTRISFGCISDFNINAMCMKSNNGFYAVVINSGLFHFLNKVIKYSIGLKYPDSINYCDEYKLSDLTFEKLTLLRNQLIESYWEFSVPRGPKVILNHPYSIIQSKFLLISELFIICHEIGHIINGDLEDNNNHNMLNGNQNLRVLNSELQHTTEYNADLRGFELLLIIFRKTISEDDKQILPLLTSCFDFFGELNGEKTSSHPTTKDRILNIAYNYYEYETFLELKKSYENSTAICFDTETNLTPKI